MTQNRPPIPPSLAPSPDRPHASGLTLKESPARAGLSLLRNESCGDRLASYVGKPDFFDIIREIVDGSCAKAALIDVSVRAVVPLDKLPQAATSAHGAASTSLGEPVQELLDTFRRVLVVTDNEGLNSLRQISHQTIVSRRSASLPSYCHSPSPSLGSNYAGAAPTSPDLRDRSGDGSTSSHAAARAGPPRPAFPAFLAGAGLIALHARWLCHCRRIKLGFKEKCQFNLLGQRPNVGLCKQQFSRPLPSSAVFSVFR